MTYNVVIVEDGTAQTFYMVWRQTKRYLRKKRLLKAGEQEEEKVIYVQFAIGK